MAGTMFDIIRQPKKVDHGLLFTVFVLVLIGIVMIYSSSGIAAGSRHDDSFFYLRKQIIWSLLGMSALFVVANINYRFWRTLQYPFFLVTLVLLVAVITPPFARSINGAMRWISIGGLTLQPSELAKLSLVFYFAGFIDRRGRDIRSFTKGVLPPLMVVVVLAALIMKEPDLGTVIFLAVLSGMMLFVSGVRFFHLFSLVAFGAGGLAAAVMGRSYRLARLATFMDPWGNRENGGFQMVQSLLAFGRGNLFGMGLGKSRQKLFFLPEIHTDFIFAFIGEEVGFLGCILVISFFILIFWRGITIARQAPDAYGMYLAYGLTYMLVLHAILNMGVVTGLLPTTGLPLPFLSYGGSSLLLNLVAVGILLNISRQGTAGEVD